MITKGALFDRSTHVSGRIGANTSANSHPVWIHLAPELARPDLQLQPTPDTMHHPRIEQNHDPELGHSPTYREGFQGSSLGHSIFAVHRSTVSKLGQVVYWANPFSVLSFRFLQCLWVVKELWMEKPTPPKLKYFLVNTWTVMLLKPCKRFFDVHRNFPFRYQKKKSSTWWSRYFLNRKKHYTVKKLLMHCIAVVSVCKYWFQSPTMNATFLLLFLLNLPHS